MTNPLVDDYISRSDQWPEEMAKLRPILLGSGLNEEIKWAKPCYSHDGKNVVILQEMKDHLSLMFFKGALLSDPEGVLTEQGLNSRSARRIEFGSVGDVARLVDTVKAYIEEAIEIEEEDLEVGPALQLVLVEELQERIEGDAALRSAFESLTSGRQREYNLYFSGSKKAETRKGRIDKCVPKILSGRGLRDR